MAKRTLPGLGLTAYWGSGADNWGDEMDANIRLMSAVTQLGVVSATAPLPVQPNGKPIHIVPDGENAGKIAIWDDGKWNYVTAAAGWRAWIDDQAAFATFDGSKWTIEDTRAEPILILASGQSNMAYVYNETTNNVAYADNLHYWNFAGWDGEVGTAFRKPAATEVSVAMCLGNEIAKGNPGRDVYVVNVSFGGTSLSAWSDNTPIAARDTLVANVQAALAQIGVEKPFDYFFWWQGENDAEPNLVNLYVENYLRFMEALNANAWFDWRATRTAIFGIMDAPRVEWATYSTLNRTLRTLVAKLGGGAVFVPSATLSEAKYWMPDGEGGLQDVHMSSLGYETISKIASVALQSGGVPAQAAFDDDPYTKALFIKGRGINFGSGDFGERFDFVGTDGNGRMSTFRTGYWADMRIAGSDTPGEATYTRNSMWGARSGETTFVCGFLEWTGHTGVGAMVAPIMPYDNVMGLDLPVPVHVQGLGNTKPVVAMWKVWTNELHFYEQDADGSLAPLNVSAAGAFSFQTIGFIA